jgi:hypothetical protein
MSRAHVHGAWLGLLLVVEGGAHAKPKPTRRASRPAVVTEAEPAPAEPLAVPEPAGVAPVEEPVPAVATDSAPAEPPPPAAEVAAPPAAAPSTHEKTTTLRAEVGALMEDLVAARAKAAILGKALFKTRVIVRVQNLAGTDAVLGRLVVSLDGAAVFRGDGSALQGEEAKQVFEGFVAPGPHTLTVEFEQRARGDDAFGYSLRQSYRVSAPREKESDLLVILDDDSSMAEDFPDDGEGEYDVRARLRQTTRASSAR